MARMRGRLESQTYLRWDLGRSKKKKENSKKRGAQTWLLIFPFSVCCLPFAFQKNLLVMGLRHCRRRQRHEEFFSVFGIIDLTEMGLRQEHPFEAVPKPLSTRVRNTDLLAMGLRQ